MPQVLTAARGQRGEGLLQVVNSALRRFGVFCVTRVRVTIGDVYKNVERGHKKNKGPYRSPRFWYVYLANLFAIQLLQYYPASGWRAITVARFAYISKMLTYFTQFNSEVFTLLPLKQGVNKNTIRQVPVGFSGPLPKPMLLGKWQRRWWRAACYWPCEQCYSSLLYWIHL